MFMNNLQKTLDNQTSVTENGMAGHSTTSKSLLDLNFKVSSLRNWSENDIKKEFEKVFFNPNNDVMYQNKAINGQNLCLKWLFYLRDREQGLGERRSFRAMFSWLVESQPNTALKYISMIPFYGRFDDVFSLIGINEEVDKEIYSLVDSQLKEDIKNCEENKPISLMAKWLPSINSSASMLNRLIAWKIAKNIGLSKKEYRKTISKLRQYLDIVEIKMSNREWDSIDYQTVPSRANLIYNSAFLRNDEERRRDFLRKLENKEVKINSSVLFPHDIVHSYMRKGSIIDQALEGMWNNLPNTVNENNNTIVVADGSGSMQSRISNTEVSALEVANALVIYFAERSSGEFKDKYITFSSNPRLVDFSKCKSLKDKISLARKYNEVSNTNIEKVFDLILKTAIDNDMEQKDLPKNILILSDMEFDGCVVCNSGYGYGQQRINNNVFSIMESKYRDSGYKLPRLVFWNLMSRTGTIPMRENDNGVCLVSGFSQNIIKMVMNGENNPYDCLIKELMGERYSVIS